MIADVERSDHAMQYPNTAIPRSGTDVNVGMDAGMARGGLVGIGRSGRHRQVAVAGRGSEVAQRSVARAMCAVRFAQSQSYGVGAIPLTNRIQRLLRLTHPFGIRCSMS